MDGDLQSKKYIVVDLDGTLTIQGARTEELKKDPPNWERLFQRCDEDLPNFAVVGAIRNLRSRYHIIFCTGRAMYPTVLEKTKKQIFDFVGIHAQKGINLFMREAGDYRPDTEIKPELLAKAGITPENTLFIMEDRNSVVAKWRELGFDCFQVAIGDF